MQTANGSIGSARRARWEDAFVQSRERNGIISVRILVNMESTGSAVSGTGQKSAGGMFDFSNVLILGGRSMTDADRDAIKLARQFLREYPHDTNMPVFVVRDLQVTEDAGLRDLAWAMYQEPCAHSEVTDLLDKLEAQ